VVTLTVVNPDPAKSTETQIALRGATVSHAAATVLAGSDMHAHNTFDQPNTVKSASHDVAVSGGTLMVTLPPGSVAKVEIQIS
jgi:alpha-N-arabinofuranosidase